MTYTGT